MASEFETGFFVKEPAWHGEGTTLQLAPQTASEAIKEAGLDWSVEKKLMFTEDGEQVPRSFALVRDKDKKILGTAGTSYTVLQNAAAFDFFDPLISSTVATYESAGSLKGGSKIWVLAKLAGDISVGKADVINKYVLLCNSHDCKNSVVAKITPVRVVCMNTLTMALTEKAASGDQIKIRHTSNVEEKVKQSSLLLSSINKIYDSMSILWNTMASIQMPPEKSMEYIKTVFPDPENSKNPYKTQTKRAEIFQLMQNSSLGGTLPEAYSTLWGAYNAVTAHSDHFVSNRKSANSSHLESVWFGTKEKEKQRALNVAVSYIKKEGISLSV